MAEPQPAVAALLKATARYRELAAEQAAEQAAGTPADQGSSGLKPRPSTMGSGR